MLFVLTSYWDESDICWAAPVEYFSGCCIKTTMHSSIVLPEYSMTEKKTHNAKGGL